MKKIYYTLICLGTFVVGGIGGYWMGAYKEHRSLVKSLSMISPIREHDPAYRFIDPLLAYIIPSVEDQEGNLNVIEEEITQFISSKKKDTAIEDASVFLSNLNKGRWIGVNEDEKYNPASMLKVIIAVAYFKAKEKQPDILNEKLQYVSEIDDFFKANPLRSGSTLNVGSFYTVEELITRMLIDSDNGAEILLRNHIDSNVLGAVYHVLNIENPEVTVTNFTISPRTYSLFFRILYSATYLRKSNSEQLLGILSKATFKEGIVAGIPNGSVASHKFGEYINSDNTIELHDCGIVYHASGPYFLCIMTRGNNLHNLKNSIQYISFIVYENYANP